MSNTSGVHCIIAIQKLEILSSNNSVKVSKGANDSSWNILSIMMSVYMTNAHDIAMLSGACTLGSLGQPVLFSFSST